MEIINDNEANNDSTYFDTNVYKGFGGFGWFLFYSGQSFPNWISHGINNNGLIEIAARYHAIMFLHA